MLSYMIPPSEEASGKPVSPHGHPQQAQQPQPLVHKGRARGHHPLSTHHAVNGHNGVNGHHGVNGLAVNRVEQVAVNGQGDVGGAGHHATTTVVVNEGGSTSTTTTFSSTSNVNGTVLTTKKIIKTYREPAAAASSAVVGVAASPYGTMSTESSASSLSTAASEQANTPTSASGDRPKPKLLANGTKNPGLKRVSFGSSKGSMVETLIYESPLQEEPEIATPVYDHHVLTGPIIDPAIIANDPSGAAGADRVRVTFFESSKPQVVEGGDALTPEDLDAPSMATDSNAHGYVRQNSTDSGWDNPFRPDGDLSREADEIVELIKGGKPITPTPGKTTPGSPAKENALQAQHSSPVTSTPHKNGANGSAAGKDKASSSPGNVDVTRGTVTGGDSAQVEHVTLKKKPKCKCCIVQ